MWLLIEPDYDGDAIIGAFSTKDLAQAYEDVANVKAERKRRGKHYWMIEEHEMNPACPEDTNGDGDCGKQYCPYCLANRLRIANEL